MEPIPEAIVEKTWQEVAGFSPDEAKKEMMKIGNSQPELLAFVMESAQEIGQEVRELTIYVFVVVYRMFQETHGKIKKISYEEIIECYEHNEGLLERLGKQISAYQHLPAVGLFPKKVDIANSSFYFLLIFSSKVVDFC